MKQDWKKDEKLIYLPKNNPTQLQIPPMNYFIVSGQGNPNDDFFVEYISVLYSLSYAIKMSPKQDIAPDNYCEYKVYPLEAVWDIADESKWMEGAPLDKDNLKFDLMIRQPSFVDEAFATEILTRTMTKKPHPLLEKVRFEKVEEGLCVQMLHLGSYDNEAASFAKMSEYSKSQNLKRIDHTHREIYLSDPRRSAPEKLKTVLRFQVEAMVKY